MLIASCVLAAMIVAGSTFAWFTSQDEVTNRLTASANYGVSIVEDFTPPIDWLPGQTINKDVSAVNTGNVDAYVRLGLLNDLKLTVAGTGAAVNNNNAYSLTDGEALVELQLNAVDAVDQGENNAVKKVPNSVSTLQAGGKLVWTPDGAVSPTNDQNQSAGDDVANAADDYDGNDQFKPTKTGLYIFRRTDKDDTIKYSGYFYDKDNDKYYALVTDENSVNIAGATITETNEIVSEVSGVKLATTKEVTVANTSNTADITAAWYSSDLGNTDTSVDAGASTAKWIQLTYTAVTGKPIKLDIALDSDWATNWTYVQGNEAPIDNNNDIGYFYYNKVLVAGNTTEKLVDSVTIDSTVTQGAYNEMTYDLTVVLDSVQITKSEDQAEFTNDSITNWVTAATVNESNGTPTWTAP